jgi:cytochrome c-type biogenesis protein CcmH
MIKKYLLGLASILLLAFTLQGMANEAQPLQSDAAVEAQVQRLATQLRCLVCQNQTLADSHAELAQDLLQEVREMAAKGMSDQAIIDYLVARYGDFVRYKPPLNKTTSLLWLGPFALLFFGGIGLLVMLRRRQAMQAELPLTAAETRQINELLK